MTESIEHSFEGVKQFVPIHRRYVVEKPGAALGLKVNMAGDYVAGTAAVNKNHA